MLKLGGRKLKDGMSDLEKGNEGCDEWKDVMEEAMKVTEKSGVRRTHACHDTIHFDIKRSVIRYFV